MHYEPQTWHYGLVAQNWAEFENQRKDAPDIGYYRHGIEQYGQPALDVACGTGRLLRPYLRAGLDVDGVDISADMVALCRFYEHLKPGGTLLLDHQMPYGERGSWAWKEWIAENRKELDPDFWTPPEVERTADGREFRKQSRLADLAPLEQMMILQMRVEVWSNGLLQEAEERTLTSNLYFKPELVLLLKAAGFVDIVVEGNYKQEAATPEHSTLNFIAKKPA